MVTFIRFAAHHGPWLPGPLGRFFIRQAGRPTGLLAMPLFSSEFQMKPSSETSMVKSHKTPVHSSPTVTNDCKHERRDLDLHNKHQAWKEALLSLHAAQSALLLQTEQSWFVHMRTPSINYPKHRPNPLNRAELAFTAHRLIRRWLNSFAGAAASPPPAGSPAAAHAPAGAPAAAHAPVAAPAVAASATNATQHIVSSADRDR